MTILGRYGGSHGFSLFLFVCFTIKGECSLNIFNCMFLEQFQHLMLQKVSLRLTIEQADSELSKVPTASLYIFMFS